MMTVLTPVLVVTVAATATAYALRYNTAHHGQSIQRQSRPVCDAIGVITSSSASFVALFVVAVTSEGGP